MKTVNVELPDYVWTALKIRAAERQTSVRHVIMTALRADGLTIAESDMIDASLRVRSQKGSDPARNA
jgi:plasmid stability protein